MAIFMKENGKNLSVMNYTIIESVIELFYFEFMQMMKNGGKIIGDFKGEKHIILIPLQ